jgi:hypothetical protein
LNLNGIPDGSLSGRIAASGPFTVKNIENNAIAREHYGVVVSRSQLESIDATALPRSNQTTATLFDKGRNDINGE